MYGTDLIWRSIRANTTSVAAAPLPKPDEPVEPISDADGWALLEALRRRLDEHAAQGRKTQAQVTQLAESIAALVAEQRRRSLWLNVNSFVAYLVFTLLCAAGCYLLYRSRARELGAARDQAVTERDTAVRRADEALARAVAREAADTKAWEIYQLLEVGQRAEAVARLDALRDQPLSRLERTMLTARIRVEQVTEIDAALRSAAAAIKAGRPGEVVKPLETALAGEPSGPRAAMMHYYLGIGYARTEPDKAVTHLEAAIAGEVDQDDARFQLASVLDRSGAYVQARAEYDRFATAHPQSPFAVFALRRSATLSRLPAAAPASAPEPAPPGPTAALAPALGAPGAPGAAGTLPAAATPAASPAPGGALAAPAGGPAAPRPLRPWPKPWPRPPAKSTGSAAPASDSPADRAAEPSPE